MEDGGFLFFRHLNPGISNLTRWNPAKTAMRRKKILLTVDCVTRTDSPLTSSNWNFLAMNRLLAISLALAPWFPPFFLAPLRNIPFLAPPFFLPLSLFLSICLSIVLSIYLLSIYPSIYLFIYLSIYFYLSIYLSIHLSICPSISCLAMNYVATFF